MKTKSRVKRGAWGDPRTMPVKRGGMNHLTCDFPPETHAAAVSLLRQRLTERRAELAAELAVVDRLLNVTLLTGEIV